MRRLCFWMFGAVQLCANQAYAQDSTLRLRSGVSGSRVLPDDARLQPGRRVRLWGATLSASPMKGLVTANTGDSLALRLTVRTPDGKLAYPTVRIAASQLDTIQVEVRTQRNTQVKRFAMLGLLVGATAFALPDPRCDEYDPLPCGRGVAAAAGGILGFFAGGFVGLLAGFGERVDWVSIPTLPQQ